MKVPRIDGSCDQVGMVTFAEVSFELPKRISILNPRIGHQMARDSGREKGARYRVVFSRPELTANPDMTEFNRG
jgi:hypothetical protein